MLDKRPGSLGDGLAIPPKLAKFAEIALSPVEANLRPITLNLVRP